MAFGIVRLYSSSEPQKLIEETNDHLDKNNRNNAYIGRSITRPNIFLLASRYENLQEKEDQDNENRTQDLMSKIGKGEFRDVSLIRVVNSNSDGKGLYSNSYLSLFGGENSNIKKTTELSEKIISIDGQSFLDKGISMFQTVLITGIPMNRTFIWHGINNYETANKFINEGLEAFHSDQAKKIIPEVLPLWTTKNRGIFKTIRNMS
ncbi:MAG: hypothetical protein CL773_02235 [Chloroflexi bacterium]|nr:hypothetical protein [Chloroflexota bacterium]|tara:strand:- start:365 stop:982 length:618 start_codon:yes stop_codon:yes gene_type:complete